MADLDWRGDEIGELIDDAAFKGLEVAAEHLLQVSSFLAPLEEGTLSRSGEASGDRSQMTTAVSYDTPYAVIQHENLTFRHDEGKQAKYLEEPMHTEKDTIAELVAQPVRDLLGG